MRHKDFGFGYHLVLHPSDYRIIADDAPTRRLVVRTVLEIARACTLLAVGLPDSHLHLQALCDCLAAGRLARRVGGALRKRLQLPMPFAISEPKPLESPGHQRRCFHYIQDQSRHHALGVSWDPYLEATNVPSHLRCGQQSKGSRFFGIATTTFPQGSGRNRAP